MVDQEGNILAGGRNLQADFGSTRHRLSLSPQIAIGVVKAIDLCVVIISSAGAFALYLGVAMHSAAEAERYFLTSLLAAILFAVGFQYIDGYALPQLRMLRWQLTRSAAVWAITMGFLLSVAFIGKVSGTYSRGWMLIWSFTTLLFMLVERGVVRLVIARWAHNGRLTRNIAVVGANECSERLIAKLQNSQDLSGSAASLTIVNRALLRRSVVAMCSVTPTI